MHAVVHHTIHDSAKWHETVHEMTSMIDQNRLPKGLKALQYLPSVDGLRAVCVWEADSLNTLKGFLDQAVVNAARNDYFEIKAEEAINLPKGDEAMAARAA